MSERALPGVAFTHIVRALTITLASLKARQASFAEEKKNENARRSHDHKA